MKGIKKQKEEENKPDNTTYSPTNQQQTQEAEPRSFADLQNNESADPQNRSFAEPQKREQMKTIQKRKVTYQGIGIYEDQYFKLRRLQAEILDTTHKKLSFAELLGEALDSYFKKKGIQ